MPSRPKQAAPQVKGQQTLFAAANFRRQAKSQKPCLQSKPAKDALEAACSHDKATDAAQARASSQQEQDARRTSHALASTSSAQDMQDMPTSHRQTGLIDALHPTEQQQSLSRSDAAPSRAQWSADPPAAEEGQPQHLDAAPASRQDSRDGTEGAASQRATTRASSGPKLQAFTEFLVYDFEATCNEARDLMPVELIEFSCCILSASSLSITSTFQEYLRPTEKPILTAFCTQLTGITQDK